MIKLLGAILIVAGCGGVGLYLAATYKKEEKSLQQLIRAFSIMENELEYRLTQLPDLCRLAAEACGGCVGVFLKELQIELEGQISANAETSVLSVLNRKMDMSRKTKELLLCWAHSLGKYDVQGQIKGITQTRSLVEEELQILKSDKEVKLRNYRTFGFCAGAALAVLLM